MPMVGIPLFGDQVYNAKRVDYKVLYTSVMRRRWSTGWIGVGNMGSRC